MYRIYGSTEGVLSIVYREIGGCMTTGSASVYVGKRPESQRKHVTVHTR